MLVARAAVFRGSAFSLHQTLQHTRHPPSVMTKPSSSALKLLSLLLTLTAIAERGALTHIDTILLGSGAVVFLMFLEAQQRAGANESWSQAGQWLKALVGPSMLPFYALLFGALAAAPQGPPPVHAPAPFNVPISPSAYPYMSQRQPGTVTGQPMMPGSAANPGSVPRTAISGIGPPSAYPLPSRPGQPTTTSGAPSLQRSQTNQRPGPPSAGPQVSPSGAPPQAPAKVGPVAASPAAPAAAPSQPK